MRSDQDPEIRPANPCLLHLAPRDVEHRVGEIIVFLRSEVQAVLGPPGCLLSGSKSAYLDAHPDHVVFFNACLWDDASRELWFGDIDLSRDADRLRQVADTLGERVHLTPERYRFDGFDLDRDLGCDGVVSFQPTGS